MILSLFSFCLAGPITIDIHTIDAELGRGTRVGLEYTLWQVRDFYADRLGIDYPPSIALDVKVYGDDDAFREAADEAGRPKWSGGWFQRSRTGPHQAVFPFGPSESRLVGVFLHEGSHFLISYGGRIPRWMNEGLAEAVGSSHTRGRELIVSTSGSRRRQLSGGGPVPVEDIVLDADAWKDLPKDSVSLRYNRAWALTTLLLSTPSGGNTLEAMAVAYRRTGDLRSSLTAIDKTYRGGRAALQRDLDAFIADPPATTTISKTLKGALNSDAVWTNCPDGRLVRTEIGCGY